MNRLFIFSVVALSVLLTSCKYERARNNIRDDLRGLANSTTVESVELYRRTSIEKINSLATHVKRDIRAEAEEKSAKNTDSGNSSWSETFNKF